MILSVSEDGIECTVPLCIYLGAIDSIYSSPTAVNLVLHTFSFFTLIKTVNNARTGY